MRRRFHEHIDPFFIYGLAVFLILIVSVLKLTKYSHSVSDAPNLTGKQDYIPLIVNNFFNENSFHDVHVTAKAYVVYDLLTNTVIASKNATTVMPLASLTKVMMAFTAISHYNKDSLITIKPESIDEGYDFGLHKGQTWSLFELLKYTLVFSSNDGAQAIADNFGGRKFFVDQMNSDAKKLGLNLYFTNPAGLDIQDKVGGSGTALDVAKMFGTTYKVMPNIFDATTKKRLTVLSGTGKIIGIPNTNQDIENISGAEASKTGFTDLAGGNLGVVVDAYLGRPVVIVVLGSTREGRFKDVEVLYQALISGIAKH